MELLRLRLKKVKRWTCLTEDVKLDPCRSEFVPRVLTEAEKDRLFKVARSNPDWYRALYCGVIAVNTTARKIEVLRSRFQDVDLFEAVWRIPKSKTRAGCREIPLNPEARAAFARMIEMGEALGGGEPNHFIFCGCENKPFDFTRHQKSVRTAWRNLTEKAGLKGFRIHDLRHQAITEMAENDVPESVMESMAGHVGKKMREHYAHIRTKAKQKAAAVLGGKTGHKRLF